MLSTTSVCKFFRGHSVGGCPRSCRTFCTASTSRDRTAGTPRQRPPSSNLRSNSPSPGRPFGASRLRALTLHAEHGLHHSCLPLCAGSKLNIPPLHPERQSKWILATGALCRPTRRIGPSRSSPSPMCLRPAGPRATPSTASHEPGLLEYVLFLKVLPVPAILLHLFDFRLELSCAALCTCRVVLMCRCRAYAQDLEWFVLSM